MDDFEDKIMDMTTGSLILASDFHARAVEWGMSVTNTKRRAVLDMATTQISRHQYRREDNLPKARIRRFKT